MTSSASPGNQDQAVASNGTALQAGRDIHYHGLSLADVERACTFFMENNFPRLQEAARLEAEKNVRSFADTLTNELKKSAATILVDKFTDPDVQAAMNDAVMGCARKGQSASPSMLAKLITNRMADNTPFLDSVLSEAVQVVSKLSNAQIAFVAYVFFTRSIGLPNPSFQVFEDMATSIWPVVRPGLGLSHSQKLHLQYCGVIGFNPMMTGNMYPHLLATNGPKLGVTTEGELMHELQLRCPNFYRLHEAFEENGVFQCDLTSVGQAIAITRLQSSLSLDLSVWLN